MKWIFGFVTHGLLFYSVWIYKLICRWFSSRVIISLASIILVILLLLLSVLGGLGSHLLLALVLLHSLLSGFHSTSILGLAARLPHIYPGAVILGMVTSVLINFILLLIIQSLAGVLTALLESIRRVVGLSARVS